MVALGKVEKIWRYLVKGMQGEVFAGFGGVMKNIIRVTALIWIVGFTNTTVAGETEGEIFGGKASGWASLGTDRVFRGESETQTSDVPSLQGSFTWTHDSGIYLGYWAGTNKFDTEPAIYAESGPYVGITNDIGDTGFNYNVFWFQYFYHKDDDSPPNHYSELWMNLSKQFGQVHLNLEVSPTTSDWFNIDGLRGLHVALTPTIKLSQGFSLSGTVGKQRFNNDAFPEWSYWEAGVFYVYQDYKFDLRYHDTNFKPGIDKVSELFEDKLVFTISKNF